MKYEQHKNQELCVAINHLEWRTIWVIFRSYNVGMCLPQTAKFHSANDGFKNFTIEWDFILFPEFVRIDFWWIYSRFYRYIVDFGSFKFFVCFADWEFQYFFNTFQQKKLKLIPSKCLEKSRLKKVSQKISVNNVSGLKSGRLQFWL